ncbi:MAG: ABC transporter substrate-binding protein [Candidatus Binatia bacterium]
MLTHKSKIKNLKWLALCAMLFALSFPVQAQQVGKVPRLGFLSYNSRSSASTRVKAFQQGVRERGYVEGQNIVIEYRYADRKRDRLPQFAAELVRLKVDVIVTTGTPPTRAAQRATKTIPIVMTIVGRAVPRFVASLAKPGGNITGLTTRSPDLAGKRLELLKEAFPQVSQVAVLWDPARVVSGASFRETEAAARALGLQLQPVEFKGANDLENALAAITRGRADALIVLPVPTFTTLRGRIVELAAKSRLPAMYYRRDFAHAGGLMAYGTDFSDNFRRAATFVDKILKGAKPADLPVERPTKFELIINLKTAKKIGVTIPPEVLYRADEVIK